MPSKDSEEVVVDPRQTATATSEGVAAETSSPSVSKRELEESSVRWFSYFGGAGNATDWFSNPANILLLTSVPFFAGAYFGYRMPTEQLEELIQGSVGSGSSKTSSKTKIAAGKQITAKDQDAIRVVAARTASKALRIATFGTVGTFGFLSAVGFYMSGYKSLKEAVQGTTAWASSWGKSLEHAMGGDQAASKSHPDVLATKHMNQDEELRYIYDKYIKEGEGDEDQFWGDANDAQEDKKPSPTLYSVYEKYFKTKGSDET